MKINPVNQTNFKSVYVALGSSDAQKKFEKKCDKYWNQMAYVPIEKDDLVLINNKKTKDLIDVYIGADEKAALILDGFDCVKYRDNADNIQNKTNLLKRAKGVLFLPFSDRK